jgi:hypothetical protein
MIINIADKITLLKLIIKREVPIGGIYGIGVTNKIFEHRKYKDKYIVDIKKLNIIFTFASNSLLLLFFCLF